MFEGERGRTKNNKLLGHFELKIEPRPRGVPQIEVTLEVDASGVLNVTATDRQTGQNDGIKVTKMKGHLSPSDIEDMIASAESYKIEDDTLQQKLEARNELFGYLSRVSNTTTNPMQQQNLTQEEVTLLEMVHVILPSVAKRTNNQSTHKTTK